MGSSRKRTGIDTFPEGLGCTTIVLKFCARKKEQLEHKTSPNMQSKGRALRTIPGLDEIDVVQWRTATSK